MPPVNYDKKKSRRKYNQPSPTFEAKDAQILNTIENQPSVSIADGSFFKKTSLDRSADGGRAPVSQMGGRGAGGTPLQGGGQRRVERFNEAPYGRSPPRFAHQRGDYYEHNIRRATLAASGERVARKGSNQQELEEHSEFNQSLKMSMQHPIYSGALPSREGGGTR